VLGRERDDLASERLERAAIRGVLGGRALDVDRRTSDVLKLAVAERLADIARDRDRHRGIPH
jgi:hypothetical protein